MRTILDRLRELSAPDPNALARGLVATRVGLMTWRYRRHLTAHQRAVRLLFSDDALLLSDDALDALGGSLGLITWPAPADATTATPAPSTAPPVADEPAHEGVA